MIAVDSDVLIEILDKKSEKGAEALKRILASGEDVCTTVMSIHEVMFGLHKYGKPVKGLLQLPVLDYTKKDAMLSSKLELDVEKAGKPIQRTDTMVAAIAINNNAVLCTFNLKHFAPLQSQGLKLLK
jgi:tRNA(fMet)-specific endonuclease VapC